MSGPNSKQKIHRKVAWFSNNTSRCKQKINNNKVFLDVHLETEISNNKIIEKINKYYNQIWSRLKMMFCQFLKASGRCLGTNIFPATKSLSIFPTSQLGLRFVRSGSPNFPTRFLRKPQVTPGSSSQLVFAQDQTEVAEEEVEKSEEVISLVNSQVKILFKFRLKFKVVKKDIRQVLKWILTATGSLFI